MPMIGAVKSEDYANYYMCDSATFFLYRKYNPYVYAA